MNKKLILLPFLAISLLVGCSSTNNGSSTSKEDSQSGSESGSSDVAKEIWEEDEVEGESTIQQVKEGTAGEYYTVRGTVVANSGSTLAIYRKGQFLYCYNFNATNHDNIAEHPLGSFVEIHAISSAYEGSVQLTAYNVGNIGEDKYDQDATLKVLQEKGETVNPVKVSAAADFANANAAGMLMEVEFVAGGDFTFDAANNNNQDLAGKVGEFDLTLRMEKYLPADVKTALLEANPAQFADHATYKVVALGAATSSGNVRGLLVEGSSWSKTADAHFDDPTEVLLDSTENEVEVGKTLALDWAVMPETAKQEVTFSSSDDTKATVDANGVITGVAAGEVTITATATAKPEVKGTFKVTVVEPVAAPVALPTEGLTLDLATIQGDIEAAGGTALGTSYKGAQEVTRGTTGIDYTVSANTNLIKATGAYTASGALGVDCLQAKKETGAFITIDSRIVSASKVTIIMYATYATEAAKYIPTVQVGVGEAIAANELAEGDAAGVSTEKKDGTYTIYEYTLTYDITVENERISFVAPTGAALKFSSILVK